MVLSLGESVGHGAISTSFWLRLCSVQSRSPKWMDCFPSPATCTSICLGFCTSFSIYTSPAPKADRASDWQRLKASSRPGRLFTRRIPRPPPPSTALTITAAPGPSEIKNSLACSRVIPAAVPGINGTPQRAASERASALFPNRSSKSGLGPMNISPSSIQRWAKEAFSLKNP